MLLRASLAILQEELGSLAFKRTKILKTGAQLNAREACVVAPNVPGGTTRLP